MRVTVKSSIPKTRFLPGSFLDRLIGVRPLTSILCRQLEELLSAARQLSLDGQLQTYYTFFGLLACTGLRISEALGLRRDEVDLKQGILTVKESKRRRFRLVPVHPSALRPLEEYSVKRTKRFPEASFFFVNRCGDRLPYTTVRTTFRKLTLRLGWVKNGKRPRLHDLRHYPGFRTISG